MDASPITVLPDGSAFCIAIQPLPKDHWLYASGWNEPPMPMKVGTSDPRRAELREQITAAARYAIRGATMNGRDMDFDPDALVQNMIIGLLGYFTPDGESSCMAVNEDVPSISESKVA